VASTCGIKCDAGYRSSGNACVPITLDAGPGDGSLGGTVVFVTSGMYNGNLGGLAGADAKCQTLATAAQLPGTYKAWLSDKNYSAASRLTHGTGPYVLVDGTVVANGWTGLTTGTLLHAIDLTEKGGVWPTNNVWTATTASGDIKPLADVEDAYCYNWSQSTFSAYVQAGFGRDDGSGSWTDFDHTSCDALGTLYCVQQ
jgi:hypothetical protein